LRKRRPEKGGSRDEDCVVDSREKNCVVEDVCDQSGRRPKWEKTKRGRRRRKSVWEKRRMRENKLARSKIPDGCRESDSLFIGVCFGGAVVQRGMRSKLRFF